MTDERFGDDLLGAIRRLPFASGVIFRQYHLEPRERRWLFGKVRRICRQRGHMLFLAGPEREALRLRADGFHRREGSRQSDLPRSAPVHSRAELREALRNRADILLISPVFPTNSHPGGNALGRPAFVALARQRRSALVIALGGMNGQRARTLNRADMHGWAAIDAFRKTRD